MSLSIKRKYSNNKNENELLVVTIVCNNCNLIFIKMSKYKYECLFMEKLTEKDKIFENGFSNQIYNTFFYIFDLQNKNKIVQKYFIDFNHKILLSHSSADKYLKNSFSKLNKELLGENYDFLKIHKFSNLIDHNFGVGINQKKFFDFKFEETSKNNNFNIENYYYVCPTYYYKSKFIDCQQMFSGKCLRDKERTFINCSKSIFGTIYKTEITKYYPIISIIVEMIEEIGLIPNINYLKFIKKSLFNTVDNENNPRTILYYTFAIDIANCKIFKDKNQPIFLKETINTFHIGFAEFLQNSLFDKTKSFTSLNKILKCKKNMIEDRDVKVQLILFGSLNNIDKKLSAIKLRHDSADKKNILGIRLIGLNNELMEIVEK